MMKRSFVVHLFICLVLGFATGSWMYLAVSQQNIYYGVLAILTAIASVLNAACGPDKAKKN